MDGMEVVARSEDVAEKSKEVVGQSKAEVKHDPVEWSVLQTSLYRYCLSLTGSTWDAEDLVQQTWAKSIGRLQAPGHNNPEAFLIRVAKNGWIDECRRRRLLIERLELIREAGEERSAHDEGEADRAMVALYRHLSPIQRTVFMLRDALGYSIAETAEWLKTSQGAVKAALHRARYALAGVREELWREEDAGGRDGDDAEDVNAGLEALAREAREAYASGRTGELIRLMFAEPAAADELLVVGRMGPTQSGQSYSPHRCQTSYTMLMSA